MNEVRYAAMNHRYLGPLLGLMLLYQPYRAEACSCAPYSDDIDTAVATAFVQADVIFLGKTTELRSDPLHAPAQRVVVFSVSDHWKGVTSDTVQVRTNAGEIACGYDFKIRKNYLVFAHWDQKHQHLTTTYCDLTRTESKAKGAMTALDRLRKQGSIKSWHELSESALVSREFALFNDFWAIDIPGGKSIRFNENGTVDFPQNPQFHGTTWTLQEKILRIAGYRFTYDGTRDCWFLPASDDFPDMGACIVPRGKEPKPRFPNKMDDN